MTTGEGTGGDLGILPARGSPQGAPHLTNPIFPSQGPCRRHMEASLQELKSSQRMVPRAVHLPNCDRKGFYKRKQVRALPAWRLFSAAIPAGTDGGFSSIRLVGTLLGASPGIVGAW